MPGLIAKMNPPSDHDEDRCGGNGRLEGRAALITSANASIGRAMAIVNALEGADILISCCNEPDDARETDLLVSTRSSYITGALSPLPATGR